MKEISLRTKFLFGTGSLILFAGFLMIILIHTIIDDKLNKELQKHGIYLSNIITKKVTKLLLTEDIIGIKMFMHEMKDSEKDISYIFILNNHNEIIAHTFKNGFPIYLLNACKLQKNQNRTIKVIQTNHGKIFNIAMPMLKGYIGITHLGITDKTEKIVIHIFNIIINLFYRYFCKCKFRVFFQFFPELRRISNNDSSALRVQKFSVFKKRYFGVYIYPNKTKIK